MRQIVHFRLLNFALLLTVIPVLAFLGCPGAASKPDPAAHAATGNAADTMDKGATNTANNAGADTMDKSATNTKTDATDSTILTKKGAGFDIRLKASVGQGYSWIILDSAWKNIRQSKPQTFEPLPDSKPGSDGIQVFHFTALNEGTETVRLIYAQPFAKPYPKSAPHKTFHIEIH